MEFQNFVIFFFQLTTIMIYLYSLAYSRTTRYFQSFFVCILIHIHSNLVTRKCFFGNRGKDKQNKQDKHGED